MHFLTKYYKAVKWVIGSIFLLGVIIIIGAELIKLYSGLEIIPYIITHLGMALVIASIIGLFLELSEIKEFFENRLAAILSRNEYIDLVSDEQLVELSVSNMRGIGRKRINNDLYDYHDFAFTVGYNILDNIGKPYRKDYFETIDYCILRPEECKDLGLNHQTLKKSLAKITSTTRYSLISPQKDKDEEFPITTSWSAPPIPGIEPTKQFILELFVDGDKVEIENKDFIKSEKEKVSIDFEKKIKFTSYSEIEIKLTWFEYELAGSYSSYMDNLTKGATVHFSSREELSLEAEIFGMTVSYDEPSITSNSVSIRYPDWILPGHGYFITWRKK